MRDLFQEQLNELKRELTVMGASCEKMIALASQGEYALDLLMIAKYFERIGDHCTNIAEWVVFSVTGIHKDCQ